MREHIDASRPQRVLALFNDLVTWCAAQPEPGITDLGKLCWMLRVQKPNCQQGLDELCYWMLRAATIDQVFLTWRKPPTERERVPGVPSANSSYAAVSVSLRRRQTWVVKSEHCSALDVASQQWLALAIQTALWPTASSTSNRPLETAVTLAAIRPPFCLFGERRGALPPPAIVEAANRLGLLSPGLYASLEAEVYHVEPKDKPKEEPVSENVKVPPAGLATCPLCGRMPDIRRTAGVAFIYCECGLAYYSPKEESSSAALAERWNHNVITAVTRMLPPSFAVGKDNPRKDATSPASVPTGNTLVNLASAQDGKKSELPVAREERVVYLFDGTKPAPTGSPIITGRFRCTGLRELGTTGLVEASFRAINLEDALRAHRKHRRLEGPEDEPRTREVLVVCESGRLEVGRCYEATLTEFAAAKADKRELYNLASNATDLPKCQRCAQAIRPGQPFTSVYGIAEHDRCPPAADPMGTGEVGEPKLEASRGQEDAG